MERISPPRRRTGTIAERKNGSPDSLHPEAWTRWRAAAITVLSASGGAAQCRAARYRLRKVRMLKRRCDEALIRQDFAHRFHAAMQETCAVARHAAIARLMLEQAAALCRVREDARAEDKAVIRQEALSPRTRRRGRRSRYRARRRYAFAVIDDVARTRRAARNRLSLIRHPLRDPAP